MKKIPITRKNIHSQALENKIEVEKLQEMIVKSQVDFKREDDIEWAVEKLGKTREWYDEATKKIVKMRKILPKDISARDEVIKLYGWIADEVPNIYLELPLITDKEYARASSVEMIMTNPNLYLKCINWD